jgi:hypothetical protein
MLGSVNGFSAGLADVPILNILTTTAKLQPDEMDKVVDNHKMSQCGANGYCLYPGNKTVVITVSRCKLGDDGPDTRSLVSVIARDSCLLFWTPECSHSV